MVGSPSGYQAAVSNGVPLGRNERSRPPRFSQHCFLRHPNSRFYLGEAEAPRGLRRKKKNKKWQGSEIDLSKKHSVQTHFLLPNRQRPMRTICLFLVEGVADFKARNGMLQKMSEADHLTKKCHLRCHALKMFCSFHISCHEVAVEKY